MPPQQTWMPASRTARQRVEAVLKRARGDDGTVIVRRGVEVVVVVVEAALLEPLRLRARQHAERDAGLQSQRLDAFHHVADRIEVTILGAAPGRAHAEALRAGIFGRARLGEHGLEAHQFFGRDAGVVFHRLRAIGAVLRAAAGLDRQQRRNLHFGGVEILPVHLRGAEQQFREWQRKKGGDLRPRPVVARRAASRCARIGAVHQGHFDRPPHAPANVAGALL